MTRGPERSRKLADVVGEVSRLADQGTTEVTLLGQTVNSYHDGEHDFADLVRAVGAVDGIRRLRFTSRIPRTSRRVCWRPWRRPRPSASTSIFPCKAAARARSGACCRRYDRERYLDVVAALRAAVPGIALVDGHHRRISR